MAIKVRPLIQDVPTRWGSTRVTSSSFLDHKDDVDENSKYKNMTAVNRTLRRLNFKEDLLLSDSDMKKVDSSYFKKLECVCVCVSVCVSKKNWSSF